MRNNVLEKRLLKNFIIAIIGIIITFGINNVYAAGISINYSSYTMKAGETKEFFVNNPTKAGNWSVYTENNNGVISAIKRTDRGYTRIECKGLKAGTANLYVRDGITGVTARCKITIVKPNTDLSVTRRKENSS